MCSDFVQKKTILTFLFVGSTLKRLCLGKERGSSKYGLFLISTCLTFKIQFVSAKTLTLLLQLLAVILKSKFHSMVIFKPP